MGAYENPQIIQQPDYGQIFLKNFQAGFAQAEAVKDRANARREKQKNKDQKLADRELAFAMKAGEIEAGELTADVQNFAYKAADNFSENERLWADNKISRDVYSKNRAAAFRKLQELNSLGKILQTQSENYDNLNASAYQKDPRSQKLLEAWEKKQIKFRYVGDDLEVYFKDGNDNVLVDINDLNKGDFFNINKKYKLQDVQYKNLTSAAQIKIITKNNKTYDTAGNEKIIATQEYDQNKDFYINQIATSSKMARLFENQEDGGSLFADNAHPSLKATGSLESTADELIKKHNIKDPNFKKAFINNTVYNNPKYKDILDGVSKKIIATEALQNHLPISLKLTKGGISNVQAKPGTTTATSAAQAIETASMDPVTFYNTQITTSPYGDSNEGAEATDKPGVFVIKSQAVDKKTGDIIQMDDRLLDLTNRAVFGKYIGTIMNRHRSVVGSSAEVRAATNKYTEKKEIDRLYKNFMDSLPKETKAFEDLDDFEADISKSNKVQETLKDINKAKKMQQAGIK